MFVATNQTLVAGDCWSIRYLLNAEAGDRKNFCYLRRQRQVMARVSATYRLRRQVLTGVATAETASPFHFVDDLARLDEELTKLCRRRVSQYLINITSSLHSSSVFN